GFSRTQYLDLYLAPGFTTNQLSKHSPEWQQAHIGVVFPEKSRSSKGHVYIGEKGLLGGGNSGSKGGGGNDNDRPSSRSESSERTTTSGSSDSSSSGSGRASHNIGSSHSSFSMPKTSSSSSSSSSHSRDSFKDFCNKSSANVSAMLSSAGIKHNTHSTSRSSDSFKDFCDKNSANVSAMLSSAGIKHDTHSTSHTSFPSHASSYSSSKTTNQVTSSNNSEIKPAAYKESSTSSKESKGPHLTLDNAVTEVRKHIQETKNDGPNATSISASQQQQAKGEQLLKQLREIKQQQERSYSHTQTAYITPGNSEIGNKLLLDQLTKKGQELSTLKELESELTQSLERERPSSHYEETKKESIPASATTTPKEIKVKDKGKERDTSLTPGTTQATNNLHSTTIASSGDISTATSTTEPLPSTPTKGPAVKVESVTGKTRIPYNDRADSFSYNHYSSSTSTNAPAVSATEPTNPATSSTTSTSTTDTSEAEIHNQWSDLLKEIQVQLGHSKIQGLADALHLQKQARFYIEKLKSYEKYNCISRSSIEQALNELEKLSVQVEAALDNERYNAVVGEIKQVLDTRIETINRLQDEEADSAIIIATAQEIKPHVEAAIKRLEDFPTKQYKAPSIENLKEAKRQLEGVIRDYTRRKVLWDKYKSAFSYAAKHVSKRIEQEQEELAKKLGKSVEKPEITITNKSGISIAQLEEIFPEDSSNNFNLQKLIDTLDITVNFPAAERASSNPEEVTNTKEAKKEEIRRETSQEQESEKEEKNKEQKREKEGESTKSYSMKVNGKELNPENFVLNNSYMAENVINLYKALVEELKDHPDPKVRNFQFKVTGGDRYEKNGKVYSSTNHQVIPNAKAKGAHMEENGARAVDIRIKLSDGSDIVPLGIVEKLIVKYKCTKLILDYNALPSIYPDKHYHLQLPNTEEYGGGKSNKN
ncbi:MAG: hypothetical protein ACYC2U_01770, partial [Candidatus Amoebophilus sp.]